MFYHINEIQSLDFQETIYRSQTWFKLCHNRLVPTKLSGILLPPVLKCPVGQEILFLRIPNQVIPKFSFHVTPQSSSTLWLNVQEKLWSETHHGELHIPLIKSPNFPFPFTYLAGKHVCSWTTTVSKQSGNYTLSNVKTFKGYIS